MTAEPRSAQPQSAQPQNAQPQNAQPQNAQPQNAGRGSSEPLWRAIAVFRFASLGYAMLLVAVIDRKEYSRPDWAWAVIAVMTVWTVATTIAYARPDRRTPLVLSADLAVTVGLLLSTAVLQYPHAMRIGVTPVTAGSRQSMRIAVKMFWVSAQL